MDTSEMLGMEAIRQVPRALGLMDRDESSPTYGCADRYYWHYKLHDFPNARFQEASDLLALAYLYRHPANPFHGQAKIRAWALAGVRYWDRIRRGDGSFDEAYPHERSFCATAFSSFHTTQASISLVEPLRTDIRPTGRWLVDHDAPDTANQRAASCAALANIAVLTSDISFRAAAQRRATEMRDEFGRLGYFNEYGGADTGYASITLSALAAYADRAQDRSMADWVKSSAAELGRSLRPNGSYDYSSQSRSTRFFYPYALSWSADPSLEKISWGVSANEILKPSWMDDRYMAPYAADYLRSAFPPNGISASAGPASPTPQVPMSPTSAGPASPTPQVPMSPTSAGPASPTPQVPMSPTSAGR